MASLTTSVEPLEGNKVRLKVAVPAAEFDQAVDAAFRKLAHDVKIPGFRPGKAPRQLVEARIGAEVARERALRDALPDYYAEAVVVESLDAIAAPEIDLTAGEESGDVEFDAVVQIRPVVTLEDYRGLRVELPAIAIDDDVVAGQIEALRDRFADLEDKAGPLADGDYASIDVSATIDGEAVDALSATDFLYEVGSVVLVPEVDEALRGEKTGAILETTATLPERFGDRAGAEASFRVLVKDTKRKVLPEATDEWVSEVSEFDTLDELRADARQRLELYARVQAQMAVRDKVLLAAAGLVDLEVPDALVEQEMDRRLRDLMQRLEQQGATIAQYLAMTGQDRETFVAEVRAEATDAAKADLALRAVVAQEAVVVSDEDYDTEVARLAERMQAEPDELRRDLEQRGLVEAVRSDVARTKALQFLVDHAEVVDESGQPLDLSLPTGSPAETPAETTDEETP